MLTGQFREEYLDLIQERKFFIFGLKNKKSTTLIVYKDAIHKIIYNLIFGMATLGLYDCFNAIRHRFDQIIAETFFDLPPFLFHSFP